MRITSNMAPDNLINQLSLLSQRQARLQIQAATGQRVQYADDDPSAMRRVLDMQAETSALNQYQANAARLKDQALASYDVIKQLNTISNRVNEIATLADGTKSPDQLKIYGAEVTQLIQQAVQLVNSKSQGDYLFAGTMTSTIPFAATTNPNGEVTSVTYRGNTSVNQAEIAEGVTLSAQTLGANTSGSGPRGLITDSTSGADFFNHMISLQNNLLAGDTNAIASTDRANLASDEDNLIFHAASSGAIQARLETASAIARNRAASVDQLISREADADLSETLVRLNETQNAYTAALQSGARIMSQSLLDYLR